MSKANLAENKKLSFSDAFSELDTYDNGFEHLVTDTIGAITT